MSSCCCWSCEQVSVLQSQDVDQKCRCFSTSYNKLHCAVGFAGLAEEEHFTQFSTQRFDLSRGKHGENWHTHKGKLFPAGQRESDKYSQHQRGDAASASGWVLPARMNERWLNKDKYFSTKYLIMLNFIYAAKKKNRGAKCFTWEKQDKTLEIKLGH